MKIAFGIKLTENRYGSFVSDCGSVGFVKEKQGWCGHLQVADTNISENIGSESPEACYRSLRGRARNVMRGLERLGVKA